MSNHPRPDLGPRLRATLAEQCRRTPFHRPPLAGTAPDARAIRSFLSPSPGRSFISFDYTQLEARMLAAQPAAQAKRDRLWQAYGGGARPPGGTRKIADLPRVCVSPQHDPPSMMVYEPGVWEHVCPSCGNRQVFTVTRPTF